MWPAYQQYQARKRPNWRAIIKAVSAFAMLTLVADILLSLYTLVYGIHIVVPDILDSWEGYTFFIIVPVLVPLLEISGPALLAYYLFLVAAIFASCTWVFLTSFKGFGKELSMTATSRQHSALFETCGLLFATLFFSIFMALVFQPEEGEMPDIGTLSESLFLLANASVWEEIAVRILLIGLPLIVVDFARRSWHKNWYAYLLGGGFKLGIPEVSLLIISSTVFGVAHFLTGWGAWKILPSAVGGFAFGYLFLKFGIAASIMLHFTTDYLSMPIEVFDSMAMTVLIGLGILLWMGFGVLFFIYYTTRVFEFLSGKRLLEAQQQRIAPTPWLDPRMQAPIPGSESYMGPPTQGPMYPTYQQPTPAPQPQPPVQPGFGGGYVCPACGNTEARWIDGKFQCLRCGKLT